VSAFSAATSLLLKKPQKWLVTGVAGFIGSHLLEKLLSLNQEVWGLDNFSTGKAQNLADVQRLVTPEQWRRFTFLRSDITKLEDCKKSCQGVDYVLHQAALCSVQGSIDDPIATNEVNVCGFLNVLVAARDARIKRMIYASSSAVYGDDPELPKRENMLGCPLSPYAVSKRVNEHYAEVFARSYGMSVVGLRYFNVFGPRQDPAGAYAAVIPKWKASLAERRPVTIYGDGSTTRDFTYVENVVQANILAAVAERPITHEVFNIAAGTRTSLNDLYDMLQDLLAGPDKSERVPPVYEPFRVGDILHSTADIAKARTVLGYEPAISLEQGLRNMAGNGGMVE
jgi:UDP-N-acetylglucosamine 4-epimerase